MSGSGLGRRCNRLPDAVRRRAHAVSTESKWVRGAYDDGGFPHRELPWMVVAQMIYVRTHRAALDDEPALLSLLESIPFPPEVRALLAKGFFGRRWQQEELCDYWLASDHQTAMCWRICGATAAEVHAIRRRFDEIAARNAEIELSLEMLCLLVCAVTGECGYDSESRVGIKLRLQLNSLVTMSP